VASFVSATPGEDASDAKRQVSVSVSMSGYLIISLTSCLVVWLSGCLVVWCMVVYVCAYVCVCVCVCIAGVRYMEGGFR